MEAPAITHPVTQFQITKLISDGKSPAKRRGLVSACRSSGARRLLSVHRRFSRRATPLSRQTYLDYVQNRYGIESEGMLTDFLSRRDGRLLLADRIDLSAMVEHYGAPLEIAYCPLITKQVTQMVDWAATARRHADYGGAFVYAYATKSNF